MNKPDQEGVVTRTVVLIAMEETEDTLVIYEPRISIDVMKSE